MFPNRLARAVHSQGSSPDTGALPPLPGTRVQARARLPRPGWKAGGRSPQSSQPGRPGPNNAHPRLRGRSPGTRAPPSACRKPQPFLELHFSSLCGKQGEDGSCTRDRPPSKAQAPRRMKTGIWRPRPGMATARERVPPQDPPRLRSRLTVNRTRGSRGQASLHATQNPG